MLHVVTIRAGGNEANYVVEADTTPAARQKALRLAATGSPGKPALFDVDVRLASDVNEMEPTVVYTFFEGVGEAEYDGETISIATEDGHYVFYEDRLQRDIVADFGLEVAVQKIISGALGQAEEAQYK